MSMFGSTSVDTDGIRRGIQVLDGTSQQLNGVRGNVQGLMGQLGASWTGEAASTFQRAMVSWDGNLESMLIDMKDIMAKLGGNAHEYDAGAQDASDIANFTPMTLS